MTNVTLTCVISVSHAAIRQLRRVNHGELFQ